MQVEIQLTGLEIARLLHRARSLVSHLERPKIGVVTIPNMVGNIQGFEEIFDIELHTYFISGLSEMERGAEQAVANSVVVEMKDAQGRLGWQSEQPLAGAAKLPGADAPELNEQLSAWNQKEFYTIARLSCFQDEALGSNMAHTIRTGSGYRWKDSDGLHWASPSDPEVQDYLVGLMVELARLGFDEIVLEHWGYPAQSDGPLGNLQC